MTYKNYVDELLDSNFKLIIEKRQKLDNDRSLIQ